MSRDIPGGVDAYMNNSVQYGSTFSALTHGGWVFVDAATNGSCILATPYSASRIPIALGISDGSSQTPAGRFFCGAYNMTSWFNAIHGSAVPTLRWVHVMGRISGTNVALYIDGIQAATVATGNAGAAGLAGIRLGMRWDTASSTRWLNGRLAHQAIWNVALTDAEILAMARGASPLQIRTTALLAYWPLWATAFPEADVAGKGGNLSQVGTCAAGVEGAPVGLPLAMAA